jgi:hypothetical protein
MARDEIQKQSAGSKKKGRKYKDIIKNSEFCLLIYYEIEREKLEGVNRVFSALRRQKFYESEQVKKGGRKLILYSC